MRRLAGILLLAIGPGACAPCGGAATDGETAVGDEGSGDVFAAAPDASQPDAGSLPSTPQPEAVAPSPARGERIPGASAPSLRERTVAPVERAAAGRALTPTLLDRLARNVARASAECPCDGAALLVYDGKSWTAEPEDAAAACAECATANVPAFAFPERLSREQHITLPGVTYAGQVNGRNPFIELRLAEISTSAR